jgi:alkaline phosphatase D
MLRRAFLRSTIASAGGVFACNREDAGTHAEGSSNGDAGREPQQECNAETGCEFFPQSVASGDPKPNSVVLWTRVVDEGREALPVELQLSTREDFSTRVMLNDQSGLALVAQRDSDFCLRVRVEDLDPAQTYFYRFAYQKNGKQWVSRIGRTRTAPAPDSEAAVHFAVMSCQDYGGRYYHVHRHLSHQDVDFVLFLGDYVYETTDDPSFQSKDPGTRRVVFDDAAGTLEVSNYGTGLADELAGEAAATPRAILAARSLDNYRQLYRTYRSDADLQRVHERFPMIAVWDDHEFSDDCYGETATYTAGREDEYSPERWRSRSNSWHS